MATQRSLQINPNIPELEKLGRHYFPDVSTTEFWNILGFLCSEEICGEDENDWAYAEEAVGKTLPREFRRIYQKPLKLWKVFEWCEKACIHVGVLRHGQSGLCRPAIFSNLDGAWFMIGKPLKTFSRRAGALACLQLFQDYCRAYVLPGADFTNYWPKYLGKQEVKAVYLQAGCSGEEFEEIYSEA